MRKYNLTATLLFFATLFLYCKQSSSSSSNNMNFKNVEFIEKFPQTFELHNKIDPNFDIIGIRNFAIYDSLLVLSTVNDQGLWSFISLKTKANLGNFFTMGQGPNQFTESPSVGTKVTFHRKDSLFAYIYDSQKGKLLKMNIDASLHFNKLNISTVHDSLPPFLFNFVMLDPSKFLCKEADPTQTQQIRYIKENNDKKTPDILNKLNNAKIKNGENINILSTITKYSPLHKKIVEMPIGLNYINMYSLDGDFSKTISLGKTLDNVDKVQDESRWDRLYTFADLRVFDNFFGVVYINEDEKTYQTNRKKKPLILLFDWNGNPLAELKLNHFITSFDIDFNNGDLYTFDVHSDEFYKYNVKDILQKLKKIR
jgi:hypothetical protein